MTAIEKLAALVDAAPKRTNEEMDEDRDSSFFQATDAEMDLFLAARAALPALIAFIEVTKTEPCSECKNFARTRGWKCLCCNNTGHEPLSAAQEAAMKKLEEALNV